MNNHFVAFFFLNVLFTSTKSNKNRHNKSFRMIWINSDMTLQCVNIHFVVVWLVAAARQVSLRWVVSPQTCLFPASQKFPQHFPLKRLQIFNFIRQTTAPASLLTQNCQLSITIKLQLKLQSPNADRPVHHGIKISIIKRTFPRWRANWLSAAYQHTAI